MLVVAIILTEYEVKGTVISGMHAMRTREFADFNNIPFHVVCNVNKIYDAATLVRKNYKDYQVQISYTEPRKSLIKIQENQIRSRNEWYIIIEHVKRLFSYLLYCPFLKSGY